MKSITAILKKEIAIPAGLITPLKIVLFSYMTFVAAMIKIYTPFSPVPFTMQTFVLFMSVYYLNGRQAGLSQALYILAGLIGAPVFASGAAGMLSLVAPTAGYLIGFVVAAVMMGFIASKIKLNYIRAFALFSAGSAVLLILGTAHLYFFYKMGLREAFTAGFAPFVAVETAKAAAAAGFYKLAR